MIKILTIDSELESAKKLGFQTFTYLDENVRNSDKDIIIRWGYGGNYKDELDKPADFLNVINPAKSIQLNCRKNVALRTLSRVVNTPKMYLRKVPSNNKYYVHRPTSHTEGRNFYVQKSPFKVKQWHYATEFINTDKEIRVWFCGNKTVCAYRVTKSKERLAQKFPSRALWPYRFIKRVPINLHKQTLLAAKAIGLEFGACDILIKNGKYYWLECNTAATLDSNILIDFYKSGLQKLVKQKFGDNFC
jgi:hypothetical protein